MESISFKAEYMSETDGKKGGEGSPPGSLSRSLGPLSLPQALLGSGILGALTANAPPAMALALVAYPMSQPEMLPFFVLLRSLNWSVTSPSGMTSMLKPCSDVCSILFLSLILDGHLKSLIQKATLWLACVIETTGHP